MRHNGPEMRSLLDEEERNLKGEEAFVKEFVTENEEDIINMLEIADREKKDPDNP